MLYKCVHLHSYTHVLMQETSVAFNPTFLKVPEPNLFKLIPAYEPDSASKGQQRRCGFICLHLWLFLFVR